jgi:hypothetical protein
MSGEDAPRPCLENLIVLEIKTNKQYRIDRTAGTARYKLVIRLEQALIQAQPCNLFLQQKFTGVNSHT